MTTITAELEQRLEAGLELCEAETDLNTRARLDRYWLQLLRRYEAAVDRERQQERKVA